MSATRHTPGPWHVVKGLGIGRAATIAEVVVGNGQALKVKAYHDLDEDFDAEADANLIAAAPDLLAALEVVVRDWTAQFERSGHLAPAWCQQARAAIAKATGDSA